MKIVIYKSVEFEYDSKEFNVATQFLEWQGIPYEVEYVSSLVIQQKTYGRRIELAFETYNTVYENFIEVIKRLDDEGMLRLC